MFQSRYRMLWALGTSPRPLSSREMAELLEQNRGTTASQMHRCEKAGLLVRVEGYFSLTPEGAKRILFLRDRILNADSAASDQQEDAAEPEDGVYPIAQ